MPAKEEQMHYEVDFNIVDENGEIKRTRNVRVDARDPQRAANRALLKVDLTEDLDEVDFFDAGRDDAFETHRLSLQLDVHRMRPTRDEFDAMQSVAGDLRSPMQKILDCLPGE